MQKLFDYFKERLPMYLRERVENAISHQTALNPNDRLQKGLVIVLEELFHEYEELNQISNMKIDVKAKRFLEKFKSRRKITKKRNYIKNLIAACENDIFNLASISCYVTQKMKATPEYISLLKKVHHPYIEMFIAYFEENPSNYQETREKVETIAKNLKKDFSSDNEILAHVASLRSWVHGQQGNIAILKEIFKYIKGRLPKTANLIEMRGLEDAATNCIWWLLHSGLEANIEEMVDYIEPYILKNKLYQSYTDYLNLKGTIVTYFGNIEEGIRYFEELKNNYEQYNDDYRLSIAIGNLAETYFEAGKIIKAKDMMEKAINLYKESTGQWPYLYLTEIGNMYYLVGDERAEKSLLHAYEIQKKEKSLFKAFIMFELIHFYLRSEQTEKVSQYMSELQELAKDLQIPSVNAQVEYLKGFQELIDQNFSNSIKYFQTSLEMAQISKDIGLILTSNIQLTAAYLQRYRLNEKAETLNLALNCIDTAILLAKENKHNQINAIGLVIRSLLQAIKGKIKNAYSDISSAREIMKKSDFHLWKEDIQLIEKNLSKAIEKGKMELDRENLFKYVLPQFKTILSLKLGERKAKESKVIGLLIITESGVPVVSKVSKSLETNKLILSGLITAINQLAENIIEGENKGRLQEVLYDKFWIILQPIKNGIVAVIATDATAEIRLWASGIAERIMEVPITINEFTSIVEEKIADFLSQMKIEQ